MKNTLQYKGYVARIEFDPDDNIFWGKIIGLGKSLSISFEGETVAELIEDFHNGVDHYLSECKKEGTVPIKPFSGTLNLRLSPELHQDAAIAAQVAGTSLNQWLVDVVKKAAHGTS